MLGKKLSPVSRMLAELKPNQVVTLKYSNKTPFGVFIAIKRRQLQRDFAFKLVESGMYAVWVRPVDERHLRRRKSATTASTAIPE